MKSLKNKNQELESIVEMKEIEELFLMLCSSRLLLKSSVACLKTIKVGCKLSLDGDDEAYR